MASGARIAILVNFFIISCMQIKEKTFWLIYFPSAFYKCAGYQDENGNFNEVDCFYGICDGSSDYCDLDSAYYAYEYAVAQEGR